MAFTCPQCLKSGVLVIGDSIELPPDGRSDEITLQVVDCSDCDFRGLAVYQESRRGALGSESWDHRGYRVSAKVVDLLANTIRDCPDPRNARCQCAAHSHFSKSDQSSRWQPPVEMEDADIFPMRLR